MTNIFSTGGFSSTVSSLTSRTAQAGQKAAARDQVIGQLAATDPEKAAKAEEKLSAMQQALEQMQQLRQDMSAVRKEAAKQKVARIKAQIQAIKMMGGDAEGNTRKLARLARDLASAVRDYKAAGGTAGVSVSAGTPAAPQTDQAAQDAAAAGGPTETAALQTSAAHAARGSLSGAGRDDSDDDNGTSDAKAGSGEDDDFIKDIRKLRRQIEAMLEKEKYRIALEQGKPGNRDTRTAEAALRDVARHTMGIENPMPSVNIQI